MSRARTCHCFDFTVTPSFGSNETLTGSGSVTLNFAVAKFVGSGSATNPTGAPLDIVIANAPEPATQMLFGLGLAGIEVTRRRKFTA